MHSSFILKNIRNWKVSEVKVVVFIIAIFVSVQFTSFLSYHTFLFLRYSRCGLSFEVYGINWSFAPFLVNISRIINCPAFFFFIKFFSLLKSINFSNEFLHSAYDYALHNFFIIYIFCL